MAHLQASEIGGCQLGYKAPEPVGRQHIEASKEIQPYPDLSKSMAPCPPSAAQHYKFVYNYEDPNEGGIPSFEPQDVTGFTPLPTAARLETQSNNCYMQLRRSRSHDLFVPYQ